MGAFGDEQHGCTLIPGSIKPGFVHVVFANVQSAVCCTSARCETGGRMSWVGLPTDGKLARAGTSVNMVMG